MMRKDLAVIVMISVFVFRAVCPAWAQGIAADGPGITTGCIAPAETDIPIPGSEADIRVLGLDECVAIALKNSFEVALAKLDLYVAETDVLYSQAVWDTFLYGSAGYSEDKRQQTSVFYPDNSQTNTYLAGVTKTLPTGTALTAEWGDRREWNNSGFVTTNPAHTAELTLSVEQPVGKNFFGYVDRATYSVTKLAVENADLDTKDRIEGVVSEASKAYWALVFTKRSVDFYSDILRKARELHETNTRNYDMGIIERGDYLASEANVQTREADLIIEENRYRTAEENLKLLMNLPEDVRILPAEDFPEEGEKYNVRECLKTAFERRRDYDARKRDVEIQEITLRMKKNEMWPEIDLVGTMAMNGIDSKFPRAFGKTTTADNTYYYAGVEVTVPVENSAARSEYKKAGFEKEKAVVALKQTERTIIAEVMTSFRTVMAYRTSLVNIKEAARLQEGKLSEEEKRFGRGRSNTKRLIDYQQDLLSAQLEEDRAQYRAQAAAIDLERSMNTLLEKYEEML